MTSFDWHPLAWELARRSRIEAAREGLRARVTLSDGTVLDGHGWTSNAACHDLARSLTKWAGR